MSRKLTHLIFTLAIVFLAGLTHNSVQAQSALGQKLTVPAYRHDEAGNNIRAIGPNGQPLNINFTVTKHDGGAIVLPNISGTQLGSGELQESNGMLPAGVFSNTLTLASDFTCGWDVTNSAAFPGDGKGPFIGNQDTYITYSWEPMDGRGLLPMLVLKVEVIGGKLYLVEKWRAFGVLAGFSPAETLTPGNPIPIDRFAGPFGDHQAWKARLVWVKVPMTVSGADARFNQKGSVVVSTTRPQGAVGFMAHILGAFFVMMDGCGSTPPVVDTPAKLCPRPANFFALWTDYLPRVMVWIPGANFNNGVIAAANRAAIKNALESDDDYVREFVTFQLNFIWSPNAAYALQNARLRDYGVDFVPILLDNGVLLTADTTIGALAGQAAIARHNSYNPNRPKIGAVLELFNNSAPEGCSDLCPLPCWQCGR